MFEPRIYRTALVPVVLAIIVLAFSLTNQQGALGTTLAPTAFSGQNVANTIATMAQNYPDRKPGSSDDVNAGAYVAQQLHKLPGYSVTTDQFSGQTPDGKRSLQNVLGQKIGFSTQRIVIVADRSSRSDPDAAGLSATATLLELARVLALQTLQKPVVIASVSGGPGQAGTTRLAQELGGSVDAVIVLGDLGRASPPEPIVVPWSSGSATAPPALRNTLAAALGNEAQLRPGGASLAGQFARLAFPLTLSAQGPLNAAGYPSVYLSLSGERGPRAAEAVSQARLATVGQAVLGTVNALEQGPGVPAPSAYIVYHQLVLGTWAVRLLVLCLIFPALAVTVDGLARAMRRGHRIGRWVTWVLAAAIPFVAISAIVELLGLAGAMPAATPAPLGAGVVPIHAPEVVVLAFVAAALLLSVWGADPLARALTGTFDDLSAGGASVAALLVMCTCTLVLWVTNPFAAVLAVPALHAWIWAVAPDLHLRRPIAVLLLIVGFVPPLLVFAYYASAFGLGPAAMALTGVLMVAGGKLGIVQTLEWCVMAGCAATVVTIGLSLLRRERPQDVPVTVRGPVTYAGPGSLGGTKSAIRR